MDDLKVGMRVRCIYSGHPRYEKIATISRLNINERGDFEVYWEDGFVGRNEWSYPSSFELAESLFPTEVSEQDVLNGGVKV